MMSSWHFPVFFQAMEFLNTLKEDRRGRANTETIEEAGTEQSVREILVCKITAKSLI